ncbi:MAG: peroxiredoxin [Nitratireductor sp.]
MTSEPNTLQEGDLAPLFNLPANGALAVDGNFDLATALKETKSGLVLFFYPKDNTPGCTKEAIGFSEHLDAFEALGVKIVGMSADSLKKHDNFRTKHNLEVTLVSDEEKSALNAFGVWVEKSMYGKKYMGIERATYLIDASGKISKIWRKVKVAGHVEEVLAACKEL